MLSQTEVRKIKLLDRADLDHLLADIDSTENYTYEFKAKFYSGQGCNEECRKDFSAFANFLGGIIFIGIDKHKNICGDNVSEINKQLDEKLRILGRSLEWDVVKTIDIGGGKYVYVVAIEEVRHYWEKPLISDSTIFIRGNGCIKTIDRISDVPDAFDFTRFLPTDVRYFEELLSSRDGILEGWTTTANTIPMHYVRIFAHCDSFLETELRKTTTSKIRDDLVKTIESFRGWRDVLNGSGLAFPKTTQSTEPALQNSKGDEVRVKLKDFIEKFNKTFKYE